MENYRNKGTYLNNTTGATGVRRKGNKWSSYIGVNGKYVHLGNFYNFEDAVRVREDAEVKYFGDYRPINKAFDKSVTGNRR